MGLRPWRLAMGVLLGLACATKWNGVFYLAGFGILTVLWDAGARRAVGIRRPLLAMLRRDAVPAFVSTVPVAIAVYVVSWTGWFATSGGWDRTWADGRTTSFGFIPAPLRSWWHYHAEMLHFNTGLTTPHNYAAKPIGWLLMVRPDRLLDRQRAAGPARLHVDVLRQRGDRARHPAAVVGGHRSPWSGRCGAGSPRGTGGPAPCSWGVAAGWLPWVILYSNRTVFTSYSVVFAPFMVLAAHAGARRRSSGRPAAHRGAPGGPPSWAPTCCSSLANTAWIWPLLVGDQLPYAQWLRRLWFRGWI